MRIFIASDHAGFEMKEALIAYLGERKYEVEDVGPRTLEPNDDYPDYIFPLASRVSQYPGSYGIGIGASGQGEAMAANRIKGIRAAVYYGPARGMQTDASGNKLNILASPRAHEDSNVLCLGARFISLDEAKEIVELWLNTPFSREERHTRRIAKLDK
jgi:ribose 5-phosphate isomerase B